MTRSKIFYDEELLMVRESLKQNVFVNDNEYDEYDEHLSIDLPDDFYVHKFENVNFEYKEEKHKKLIDIVIWFNTEEGCSTILE